jgi:pyruvate kinase
LDWDLPALTEMDKAVMPFNARNADLVGCSNLHRPEDLKEIMCCLSPWNLGRLGLLLKVETCRGCERLPEILLEAMKWPKAGVMIGGGVFDMESGFKRGAELKEEILRLCEAAHLPVMWATQILDSLVRKGIPSRADMSDAALASRAEAILLNQGPLLDEALRVLEEVISQMAGSGRTKQSLARPGRTARQLVAPKKTS